MKEILLIVISLTLLISCKTHKPQKISLSGEWAFRMDDQDKGIAEKWFMAELPEKVKLPGSMTENGKGYEVGPHTKWTGGIMDTNWMKNPNYAPFTDSLNFRFPFWLQPVKRYVGPAWYQRKISIPNYWKNTEVFLNLERCHWESTVWIDDKLVGMQNALGAPHRYNLTPFVNRGYHILTVRIDNRVKDIDPGENSHSITDHTQSNWNGITGDISLETQPRVNLKSVSVFPDVANKNVLFRMVVANSTGAEQNVKVTIDIAGKDQSVTLIKRKTQRFKTPDSIDTLETSLSLGNKMVVWDEFNPWLYDITVKLDSRVGKDIKTFRTGFRNVKTEGSRIVVNSKPVFIRGTLECAVFPKTGFPPTDKAEWTRIIRVAKSYGLNNMRFHSWCPPEAAFAAADEEGMYFQIECSSWANQSTSLGEGKPIDNFIWDESKRIVSAYGNHPSFLMMAYGNEPRGRDYKSFLTQFVNFWKKTDSRRVYTAAAGWPELPVNDYHNIPGPRLQGWGEELKSLINSQPPRSDFDWKNRLPQDGKPVVSHEIGQWCVYPDFKETAKYTGNLKARNFEIFQKSLEKNGMGNLADSFLLASGKLQALCYKADIEAALRTPGFAGFQLLDLHDFPGQGTALVGVLSPFWEEKGYVTAAGFSRFCNSTVPLARLPKMVYYEGDTLSSSVEVAHFGKNPVTAAKSGWNLKDSNGTLVAEGKFPDRDIEIGNSIILGNINFKLPETGKPRKLILETFIESYSNSWDLWVYPKTATVAATNILITGKMDKAALDFLQNGGNVLLSLGQGKVSPEMGGDVGVGFSPIFWNTAWTHNQKPHTLGILCNPSHPLFDLFPTEFHSNYQWQYAMSHADAINLKEFPESLKPIVRIIDDWVTNRPLALIFEVTCGKGKLMVCGADLINNFENRPEAVQLKNSILSYMNSGKFNPATNVKAELLQKIVRN